MKVGLIITTYNRPAYLKECFASLLRADLSKLNGVLIVDDNSTELETEYEIRMFGNNCPLPVHLHRNEKNISIKGSLLYGFNYFFDKGFDIVINLDADAIARNDFIDRILEVKEKYPALIVTGFCCDTLNKDGSVRHKHLYKENYTIFRASVGGINMCVNIEQYLKYIKPALLHTIEHGGNWDALSCINSMKDSLPIACVNPSVIQHIGFQSSMNHNAGGEPADTADTFKPLSLCNVTLIAVDDNVSGIIKAADISCKDIEFAAVKLLSCEKSNDKRAINIERIGSKEKYSRFVFDKLVDYIETEYFIVFQADGWIKNWKAWSSDFFKFDYIGAPWNFYSDGMQVGNGGLSFRSKRLHDAVKSDPEIFLINDHLIKEYQEDHNLCRIYRKRLEEKYNIKFAPVDVAEKFSIEAYGVKYPGNKYRDQFGFHGTNVVFQ